MRSVVIILALARIAIADPEPQPKWSDDAREPAIGTLLAVVGTAAPLAVVAVASHTNIHADHAAELFAVTATITPACGRWYGGEIGAVGMGIRALGGFLFASAIREQPSDSDPPAGPLYAGLILIGAGALYDIAMSHDSVRRWNATRGITPTVVRLDHGGGVGVTGRF